MRLEQFYACIGGDYKGTLSRLPSERLILKFVRKYVNDPTCAQLDEAVEAKDWETAFRAAHTLKGVSQNLGFDKLYQVSAALTEATRGPKPLEDYSLWKAVDEVHKEILEAVGKLED